MNGDSGRLDKESWSFTLPITKPLSMNDRGHHIARSKQVKALREATGWLSKQAKVPRMKRCRVTLIYEPRDARRRDPINLSATLKAVQDGLVDARVVPDDTLEYMESPVPMIDAPSGQPGKLWVLVERLR